MSQKSLDGIQILFSAYLITKLQSAMQTKTSQLSIPDTDVVHFQVALMEINLSGLEHTYSD